MLYNMHMENLNKKSVIENKAKPIKDKVAPRTSSSLALVPQTKWLFWSPHDYLDFTSPSNKFGEPTGDLEHFVCTMVSITGYTGDKNETTQWSDMFRLCISLVDTRGKTIIATIFGNPWPWKPVKPGDTVHVYGRLVYWNMYLQLESVRLLEASEINKILPVYKGIPGKISAAKITKGVTAALPLITETADTCAALGTETNEQETALRAFGVDLAEFSQATGFQTPIDLFTAMHAPVAMADGRRAIAAAVHFSLQKLLRDAAKNGTKLKNPASAIPIDIEVIRELNGRLPYNLTAGQKQVVKDIIIDLRSDIPMRRVLNGDVGTGKSLAFLLPAVAAVRAGAFVGIMTPNRLLVEQLAGDVAKFFPGTPVQVVSSGGKLDGTQGIVIGTTAILGAIKKAARSFDFVILDEQHKFSVNQKLALVDQHTNLLEATATPIPRTLAVISFGGVDVSMLTEMPVEKEIVTRIMLGDQRKELMDMVMNVVKGGKQVAIIYSRVGSAKGETLNVETSAAKWEKNLPGQVATLHGQMKEDAKIAAIASMVSGGKRVLVASSVIEIGVTLPDLGCLVVVNADRFGVSQLHQMRGRVARAGGHGDFVLYLPDPLKEADDLVGKPNATMDRMRLVEQYTSGFDLAERDLQVRGYGDVSNDSEDQTGNSDLLFSGIKIPYEMIKAAIGG